MKEQYTGDLFSMPAEATQASNPFQNRRIAIIGEFMLDVKVIRQRFIALGCTIDSKVTRNTHYALVSNSASEDRLADLHRVRDVRGWDVRVLSEADLNSILSGCYDGYDVPDTVRKNLHMSYEHFSTAAIVPDPAVNPVLEENIFVPKDICPHRDMLCQIIGNIGAYANDEIVNESESDKTKPIILLGDSTIECLRQGSGDDVTRYIEQTYNASRSDGLSYEFLSLTALLQWIHQRSVRCGDQYTLGMLQALKA